MDMQYFGVIRVHCNRPNYRDISFVIKPIITSARFFSWTIIQKLVLSGSCISGDALDDVWFYIYEGISHCKVGRRVFLLMDGGGVRAVARRQTCAFVLIFCCGYVGQAATPFFLRLFGMVYVDS